MSHFPNQSSFEGKLLYEVGEVIPKFSGLCLTKKDKNMDKKTEIQYIMKQILQNHDRMTLGNLGERLVKLSLPSHWLFYQGRTQNEGDMRIYRPDTAEVLTLEIKASKRGKRGFRFNINQSKRASCQHADVVVLLCVTQTLIVPFIIPASLLKHVSSLSIESFPTEYRGKYSPYRQSLNRLNFEVQALS